MRARWIFIVVFSIMLFNQWPQSVWGHAFPDHSDPQAGSIVTVAPTQVRIWFDGELEPAFSSIRVHNASGQRVDKGDGHVESTNPTLLEVSLPSLPTGNYHVFWSVVARDGHRTEGDYTFTVK